MFNLRNIGGKIAELRRAKNMTQMELADRLGISYQAVSNWERGNTMPDISKLPELIQIFGVTLGELLGEECEVTNLLESAANERVEEYMENHSVDIKELSEVAPVLKPTQVGNILEKTKTIDWVEISTVIPFVEREVVDRLVMKAVEEGQYDNLEEAMPFVSKGVADKIADKILEQEGDSENFLKIAPFLSKDKISKLAEKKYYQSGLKAIEKIMPFIEKETLQKIAEEEVQKNGVEAIASILPFAGKQILSKYIMEKYL